MLKLMFNTSAQIVEIVQAHVGEVVLLVVCQHVKVIAREIVWEVVLTVLMLLIVEVPFIALVALVNVLGDALEVVIELVSQLVLDIHGIDLV